MDASAIPRLARVIGRTVEVAEDFLKVEGEKAEERRPGQAGVYRSGITCTGSDSLPCRGSVVKWTISSRVTTMLPLPNKTTRSDVSPPCVSPSCSPRYVLRPPVLLEPRYRGRYNLYRVTRIASSNIFLLPLYRA